MLELHQIIQTALLGWLAALAAIVLLRLFQGRINLRGLASDRAGGRATTDRLALVAITLGGAAFYFITAMKAPGVEMPPPPDALLFLLGGSQAAYLTGKFVRLGGG
jgi:hypothetical protein